jgi:hypothetical protein
LPLNQQAGTHQVMKNAQLQKLRFLLLELKAVRDFPHSTLGIACLLGKLRSASQILVTLRRTFIQTRTSHEAMFSVFLLKINQRGVDVHMLSLIRWSCDDFSRDHSEREIRVRRGSSDLRAMSHFV